MPTTPSMPRGSRMSTINTVTEQLTRAGSGH